MSVKIKTALISVFYKDGLAPIVKKLNELGVEILSTGGTQKFIEEFDIPVTPVESLTGYPSILGGRVKTLHPAVFGGILSRRELDSDKAQLEEYKIPEIDLVIVDLYPFEETVASGASEQDIIEKIDIGGISLIRAAAKNFKDVLIVSSRSQYDDVLNVISAGDGTVDLATRKKYAGEAFDVSSHYDSHIYKYFNPESDSLKLSERNQQVLRYGENPHQKGYFYGKMDELFDKKNGKELSYNNLLDVDAAVNLIADYDDCTCAILKHNNACGLATRETVVDAFKDALAGDPISAFGGIIITNREVDLATATEIDKIFYEVVIAPSFSEDALALLSAKKNRIILVQKETSMSGQMVRTALNGFLVQDKDVSTQVADDLKVVTKLAPTGDQVDDLLFANKLVKHTKSNTIVLAKDGQLLASGTGQTSRVDALKQAILKAQSFGFDLSGAVMASDAFFPFADCVEIANEVGIKTVIQPGGSIKDNLSIEFCDNNEMSMVMTGVRHFKH
ncbi:bifunctional phosphoribosylaminoimidazolecarboxamide formyltransferase/IMP cyclohydrolase [bacterium SCSIO 12643]|nr:bifunctional phosphoribosylaminoimidazolecarboxamide formyltransferase/IMP cyclohydrolase [bacterium SCSIO 12643]